MIINCVENAPYVCDKYPYDRIRRVLLSPELFPDLREIACGIVEIPPGSKSDLHMHDGNEMWFCISGNGHVRIGEEVEELRPNMAVWSPSNCIHQLLNDKSDKIFVLLFILIPPGKEKEIVSEWRSNNTMTELEG